MDDEVKFNELKIDNATGRVWLDGVRIPVNNVVHFDSELQKMEDFIAEMEEWLEVECR